MPLISRIKCEFEWPRRCLVHLSYELYLNYRVLHLLVGEDAIYLG